MSTKRLSILMLLLLTVFWLVTSWYFVAKLKNDQQVYLQQQLADLSLTWRAVERWQQKGRDLAFQSFVQTEDVWNLLIRAQEPVTRDQAREALLDRFSSLYIQLSQQGVYQLQFSLPDNISLLRLHRPDFYGDNLSDVRPSFQLANESLKPHFSFEFGRLQPGFRSVYPIIGFDQHLGAVELSSSLEILRRDLSDLDNSKEYVFVLKSNAQDILFAVNSDLLETSSFNQAWLQENPMFDSPFPIEPMSGLADRLAAKLAAKPTTSQQMATGESFVELVQDAGTSYVVSFLAISDISETNQAYLIGINQAPLIDGFKRSFIADITVTSLMLLALAWMLYSLIKNREELRIAATAFNVQEGITVTDTRGRILKVNDSFTRLTGYESREVIGKTPAILSSGMQDKMFYQAMWKSLMEQGSWQGEVWNRRKNGEIYVEWLAITAVYNRRNEVTHYVGAFLDITQRKEDEEQIRRLAFYDSLTDLPNRRLLNDRVEHALATCARTYRNGAILFIDMDNFKTLNDTKGHDVGDLMLQEVANRLKACVRQSDTVARIGGDEFVILIENLNSNQQKAYMEAEYVAEEIRSSLSQPYHFSDYIHFSSPSIGVAIFGYPAITLDELMKNADSAMYQAKNAGRNQIRVFDPEMQRLFERRSELETDLAIAIKEQQLELYLQPLVDVNSKRIVAAEALIRWNHPTKGQLLPEEFIEIAAESGLLAPINNWLFEQTCEWLAVWHQQPGLADLQVSVNINSAQLQLDDFRTRICSCVDVYRVPAGKLVIELSENDLPKDVSSLQTAMQELISKDIVFALDNFGSGKAVVPVLAQLNLAQVKLDCGLISQNFAAHKTALAKALQAVAASLDLQTQVVGVESEAQSKLLAEIGYQVQQGNLFAEPLPVVEFEALVREQQQANG